jgi:mono/diheme cytochrome c family protein
MKMSGHFQSLRIRLLVSSALLVATVVALPEVAQSPPSLVKLDPQQVERGKYLVKITGCNDCHTPRYAGAGGQVPEAQWLVGDKLGWRGPWGTTYPINLRLYMQDISEDRWVHLAKTRRTRPPMPWFALRDMTEHDLRAIYQFIRSLGPAGEVAPAYVPPEKVPQPPYVQFPVPSQPEFPAGP